MPLTPEHSIYYPDSQMNITPLESHFAALATSVDAALGNVPRIASGHETIPVGSASWEFVSFPSGSFTRAPVVVASVADSAADANGVILQVHDSTSTASFRVKAEKASLFGGTTPDEVRIAWQAIQSA